MISHLLSLLAQGGVDDPTPEELADILWLAQRVLPQGRTPGHASETPGAEPADVPAPGESAEPASADARSRPDYEDVPADEEIVGLHVPGGDHDEDTAGPGGTRVPVPAVTPLPRALALTRALKPLARKVPSRTAFELDEEATVARLVDEDILLPVLRPEPARWLSLALVVDCGPSMSLWQDEVHELQHEAARLGAFRGLRRWNLLPSPDGTTVEVRPYPAASRPARHPREVVDPAGAQLIVVLSDTAGAMWRTGAAHRLLADWGRHSQVALAHLLPAALWSRVGTAPVPTRLHVPQPGLPNSRWRTDRTAPTRPAPVGIPVPVVDLDPGSLRAWAEMTAGSGRWTTSAALFVSGARRVAARRTPVAAPPASAEEIIRRFRATSSPRAWKLAGLLSAHSPVTVPLARLVQRAMLRDASRGDLAEVFLGGLLRRTHIPSLEGELRFEFPAEVREALLGAQYRDDVEAVRELVRTQLTAYLRPRFGSPRSTRAAVTGLARDGVRVAVEGDAYARVSRADLVGAGATTAASEPRPEEVAVAEVDDRNTVFISYAGPDRAWAEWVAWHLQEAGHRVELDIWDWRTGDDHVSRMNAALARASKVVALFSKAYFEPGWWTAGEMAAVIRGRGHVVPLVVEPMTHDDIPAVVAPLLRRELHGLQEPEALHALFTAVEGPARPEESPRFPGGPTPIPSAAPRLPTSTTHPAVWNVPPRNPDFVGREDALRHVRETLLSNRRAAIRVLHGMGGVGKSQMALEYAHRFSGQYDVIWWVDAEDPDRLPAAYAELAEQLGIARQGVGPEANARHLLDHLRTQSRWLIVLDEADDPSALAPWLPTGDGHVLITSRSPAWQHIAHGVALDTFSRADSLHYLESRVPGLTGEKANALAEKLGDLPLALAQAAGLLAQGVTVDQFGELLRSASARLLGEAKPPNYPVTLAATLRLAAERLTAQHPDAARLLDLVVFFGPDPIPVAWLEHASGPLDIDAADVAWPGSALQSLVDSGLARVDQATLRVHRLTQAIHREHTDPSRLVAQRRAVTSILEAATPGDPARPEYWPLWEQLTAHLVGRPDPADTDQFSLHHTLLGSIRFLLRSGRPQRARTMCVDLHKLWSSHFGTDHPDTLTWAMTRAEAETATGAYGVAHRLASDVLEHRRRILGEDHPDTIAAARGLSGVLNHLGEHEEARRLCEDAFQRSRHVLGTEHPDTLTGAHNLAVTRSALGEYQSAAELLRDVLDRRRQILGEDHPDTLASESELAGPLIRLGRLAEAHDVAQDVLERRRRVLSDDHPDTLGAMMLLASAMSELQLHSQARPLAEEGFDRLCRTLGEDHPASLGAARQLAFILSRLRSYREAVALWEATLARSRRVLGDDDPSTAAVVRGLVNTYLAMGQPFKAQQLLNSQKKRHTSRAPRR